MSYDNLKLEKGMYRQEGMNFTQVLESLDPSENYRGTALEGTDAFQRQLKRFGIRVKSAGSSPVEKFFRTMDSAVLFPEYIARTVRQAWRKMIFFLPSPPPPRSLIPWITAPFILFPPTRTRN